MATDPEVLGSRVYVIGAGFSAGLGFPLTNELLALALARMHVDERNLIVKIIAFHFPYFEVDQLSSYPNIEDLLTRIKINIELFHATRSQEGNLKLSDLKEAEQHLLHTLVVLFHQIMKEMGDPEWLRNFVDHVKETAAAIISFNWDLVLDVRLGADHPSQHLYGAGIQIRKAVRLFKPHGSLNWYQEELAQYIKEGNLLNLWKADEADEQNRPSVWLFKHPRLPTTSVPGRQYVPWIVPPTFSKTFDHPFFSNIVRSAIDRLSIAKEVVFLGYSMPSYDFHAEFMFRCAFHNQKKGTIVGALERAVATGEARVLVVNPDAAAANRIRNVLGVDCGHYQTSVATWALSKQFSF